MAASYISVPRDLTKVKSKVMFNLTKRQLICFGLAALVGVPSFFLLKLAFSISTSVMIMMVIMMPFFFLAMYVSDGTLWEGQIALYFRWTCLPDCAVPELDADYRRNNRRLS